MIRTYHDAETREIIWRNAAPMGSAEVTWGETTMPATEVTLEIEIDRKPAKSVWWFALALIEGGMAL